MGRIGPPRQRFEVLPAPAWTLEDLVGAWERDSVAPRDSAAPRDTVAPRDTTSQPDPAGATERPEAPSER